MKMRNLGASGIAICPIAMGCWAFGGGAYWGSQSQKDVNQVVARALGMGVNLFDTAEMYNAGQSEKSLGIALAGRRESAVILSKIGPDNAYYDTMIEHCEASLKRLQTDYLDVYMLHWPINEAAVRHFTDDPEKIANPPSVEEAFLAFETLKRSGKIRAVGVSNFGVGQMRESLMTGTAIDVNEMPYNLFSRAIEAEIMPFCKEREIGVVGSMALQQGILTGMYDSADKVPPNQAHSRHFHESRGLGASRHGGEGCEAEMFIALEGLREMANELHVTLPQLAIAWVLNHEGLSATLVGSRNERELLENVKAMEIELTDAQMHTLNALTEKVLTKLGNDPDYYESAENSRIW